MLFNLFEKKKTNVKQQNHKNNNNKQIEYEIIDFPKKNLSFGSYKGRYTKQAAEKAFTFLSNLVGQDIDEEGSFLVFVIRNKETQKINKYIGTRIELENKVINNYIQTPVKYKNVISKYNPMLDKIKFTKIIQQTFIDLVYKVLY